MPCWRLEGDQDGGCLCSVSDCQSTRPTGKLAITVYRKEFLALEKGDRASSGTLSKPLHPDCTWDHVVPCSSPAHSLLSSYLNNVQLYMR